MPRKVKNNDTEIVENQMNNNDNNDNNDNADYAENVENMSHDHDDKDSSEISEIDENESLSDCFNYDIKKDENDDNIDSEAQTEYVKNVVFDYVIKYIKIDDIIKKKQTDHKKEMKAIKDTKDQLETFLLNYLEKVNQEYVELANKSKLIKTETTTKSAPKLDDINLCLMDGFKEHGIFENDDEIKRVVGDLMKKIDEKRETKSRSFLRRVNVGKNTNAKKEKENKENNPDVKSRCSRKTKDNPKENQSKKTNQNKTNNLTSDNNHVSDNVLENQNIPVKQDQGTLKGHLLSTDSEKKTQKIKTKKQKKIIT
jgi:hypothetical protein